MKLLSRLMDPDEHAYFSGLLAIFSFVVLVALFSFAAWRSYVAGHSAAPNQQQEQCP